MPRTLKDLEEIQRLLNEFKSISGMSPKQKAIALKEMNIDFHPTSGQQILPNELEPELLRTDLNRVMAQNQHMKYLEDSARRKGWRSNENEWITPNGQKINKKDAELKFLDQYKNIINNVEPKKVSDVLSQTTQNAAKELYNIGNSGTSQLDQMKGFAGGVGQLLSIPQKAAFQYAGKELGIRPDKEGLYSGKELVNPLLKQVAIGTPEDKERFAENVSPIAGAITDVVADPLNFVPGPGAVNKVSRFGKLLPK